MNPEDRRAFDRLLAVNRAARIPLLLKNEVGMLPCPADVPWRGKFEAAVDPLKKVLWQEAAERLTAFAAEVPDAPAVWGNLACIRSWLGEDEAACEALQRFAALDIPLEDAVEAEATAMLLRPPRWATRSTCSA